MKSDYREQEVKVSESRSFSFLFLFFNQSVCGSPVSVAFTT